MILLIDGNNLVTRAFHGMKTPMTDPAGRPVGAIYGFLSMTLRAVSDLAATHWAVAWDTGDPTFRHQLYQAYKAGRAEKTEELRWQLETARTVCDALSLPRFEWSGFEADDILLCLALDAFQHTSQVTILSNDRDTHQITSFGARVASPGRATEPLALHTAESVQQKYGVRPDQIASYKALCGEESDNIPGVTGIGPKAAQAILRDHDNLGALYRCLDGQSAEGHRCTLTERQRALLLAGRESAFLSLKLARLSNMAPAFLDIDHCRITDYDPHAARRALGALNCGTLLNRMPVSLSARRAS